MKHHLLAFALIGMALAASPAHATLTPSPFGSPLVIFHIDTTPLNTTDGLTQSVQSLGNLVARIDAGGHQVFDFSNAFNIGPTGIDITGTISQDPYIQWTVSAVNFQGLATGFSAELVLPVAGGPFSSISSSFSGKVTDLHGDGAFVFGLNAHSLLDFASVPELDLGPGAQSAACEQGSGTAGRDFSCGTYGLASAALAANYGTLDAQINFVLSSNDVAVFSGTTELAASAPGALPEPGGLWLMLAALTAWGMAWAGRRAKLPR